LQAVPRFFPKQRKRIAALSNDREHPPSSFNVVSMSVHSLVAVAALVPALLFVGSWLVGDAVVRSPGKARAFTPAAPARDIGLRAADGLELAATCWPGARADSPGVLLLHGIYDSRADLAETADWLAAQGFAVLALDLRGHGRSARAPHSFGWNEALDARAGFDWLKTEQNGAPVGVLGVSLGGAAALLGASGPLPADAMILQAVFPDIRRATRNRIAAFLSSPVAVLLEPLLSWQSRWRFGIRPERLAPVNALPRVETPVLIVGGGADRYTPPHETWEMHAAAGGAKDILILAGLDHDQTSHVASQAYRERILGFFLSTLGAP
jgi:uncharacterized protein